MKTFLKIDLSIQKYAIYGIGYSALGMLFTGGLSLVLVFAISILLFVWQLISASILEFRQNDLIRKRYSLVAFAYFLSLCFSFFYRQTFAAETISALFVYTPILLSIAYFFYSKKVIGKRFETMELENILDSDELFKNNS